MLTRLLANALFLSFGLTLSGCGFYVPQKDLMRLDSPEEALEQAPPRAKYEDLIVRHITCEVAHGLYKANSTWKTDWLEKWGVAVTIIINAQDQAGINPSLSLIDVLPNSVKLFPNGGTATNPRSFSLSMGLAAATNATRSETIQYTYINSDLLRMIQREKESNPSANCSNYQQGIWIDSDLRIADFIYDKLYIAFKGNATGIRPESWPIFNTMTEEIIFLTSFGGNVNPLYKFASSTIGASGNLVSAQRTYTNDVIITFGTIKTYPSKDHAAQLGEAAQFQHNSKVQASAIATAVRGQSQ